MSNTGKNGGFPRDPRLAHGTPRPIFDDSHNIFDEATPPPRHRIASPLMMANSSPQSSQSSSGSTPRKRHSRGKLPSQSNTLLNYFGTPPSRKSSFDEPVEKPLSSTYSSRHVDDRHSSHSSSARHEFKRHSSGESGRRHSESSDHHKHSSPKSPDRKEQSSSSWGLSGKSPPPQYPAGQPRPSFWGENRGDRYRPRPRCYKRRSHGSENRKMSSLPDRPMHSSSQPSPSKHSKDSSRSRHYSGGSSSGASRSRHYSDGSSSGGEKKHFPIIRTLSQPRGPTFDEIMRRAEENVNKQKDRRKQETETESGSCSDDERVPSKAQMRHRHSSGDFRAGSGKFSQMKSRHSSGPEKRTLIINKQYQDIIKRSPVVSLVKMPHTPSPVKLTQDLIRRCGSPVVLSDSACSGVTKYDGHSKKDVLKRHHSADDMESDNSMNACTVFKLHGATPKRQRSEQNEPHELNLSSPEADDRVANSSSSKPEDRPSASADVAGPSHHHQHQHQQESGAVTGVRHLFRELSTPSVSSDNAESGSEEGVSNKPVTAPKNKLNVANLQLDLNKLKGRIQLSPPKRKSGSTTEEPMDLGTDSDSVKSLSRESTPGAPSPDLSSSTEDCAQNNMDVDGSPSTMSDEVNNDGNITMGEQSKNGVISGDITADIADNVDGAHGAAVSPMDDQPSPDEPPQQSTTSGNLVRPRSLETLLASVEKSDEDLLASDEDSDDDFLMAKPSALQDTAVSALQEIAELSTLPPPDTPEKTLSLSQISNDSLMQSPSQPSSAFSRHEKPKKLKFTLDSMMDLKAQDGTEESTDMTNYLQNNMQESGVVESDNITDLKAMQQAKLEQYRIDSDQIPALHPGDDVFDSQKMGELFCFPDNLSLQDCGFNPLKANAMEKLLLSASPDDLIELINSQCLREIFAAKPCPDSVMSWLFQLMSIHPSVYVTQNCFQTLWYLLTSCLSIHPNADPWVPTLREVARIFVNYGGDLNTLLPESIVQPGFSSDDIRCMQGRENGVPIDSERESSSRAPCHDNYGLVGLPTVNVMEVIKIFTQVLVTHGLKGRGTCYSPEELVCLLFLVTKAALDLQLIGLAVQVDFQLCISAILEGFDDNIWDKQVLELCNTLSQISEHHHNLVYVVQLMPTNSQRGRLMRRRLSYAMLKKILASMSIQTSNMIQFGEKGNGFTGIGTVKVSDLLPILHACKPDQDTDYYRLNSVITLIDLGVGNEPLKSLEKEDLERLILKLRELTGDIKDGFRYLNRVQVKDLMLRTVNKMTVLSQSMMSKQVRLEQFMQVARKRARKYSQSSSSDEDKENQVVPRSKRRKTSTYHRPGLFVGESGTYAESSDRWQGRSMARAKAIRVEPRVEAADPNTVKVEHEVDAAPVLEMKASLVPKSEATLHQSVGTDPGMSGYLEGAISSDSINHSMDTGGEDSAPTSSPLMNNVGSPPVEVTKQPLDEEHSQISSDEGCSQMKPEIDGRQPTSHDTDHSNESLRRGERSTSLPSTQSPATVNKWASLLHANVSPWNHPHKLVAIARRRRNPDTDEECLSQSIFGSGGCSVNLSGSPRLDSTQDTLRSCSTKLSCSPYLDNTQDSRRSYSSYSPNLDSTQDTWRSYSSTLSYSPHLDNTQNTWGSQSSDSEAFKSSLEHHLEELKTSGCSQEDDACIEQVEKGSESSPQEQCNKNSASGEKDNRQEILDNRGSGMDLEKKSDGIRSRESNEQKNLESIVNHNHTGAQTNSSNRRASNVDDNRGMKNEGSENEKKHADNKGESCVDSLFDPDEVISFGDEYTVSCVDNDLEAVPNFSSSQFDPAYYSDEYDSVVSDYDEMVDDGDDDVHADDEEDDVSGGVDNWLVIDSDLGVDDPGYDVDTSTNEEEDSGDDAASPQMPSKASGDSLRGSCWNHPSLLFAKKHKHASRHARTKHGSDSSESSSSSGSWETELSYSPHSDESESEGYSEPKGAYYLPITAAEEKVWQSGSLEWCHSLYGRQCSCSEDFHKMNSISSVCDHPTMIQQQNQAVVNKDLPIHPISDSTSCHSTPRRDLDPITSYQSHRNDLHPDYFQLRSAEEEDDFDMPPPNKVVILEYDKTMDLPKLAPITDDNDADLPKLMSLNSDDIADMQDFESPNNEDMEMPQSVPVEDNAIVDMMKTSPWDKDKAVDGPKHCSPKDAPKLVCSDREMSKIPDPKEAKNRVCKWIRNQVTQQSEQMKRKILINNDVPAADQCETTGKLDQRRHDESGDTVNKPNVNCVAERVDGNMEDAVSNLRQMESSHDMDNNEQSKLQGTQESPYIPLGHVICHKIQPENADGNTREDVSNGRSTGNSPDADVDQNHQLQLDQRRNEDESKESVVELDSRGVAESADGHTKTVSNGRCAENAPDVDDVVDDEQPKLQDGQESSTSVRLSHLVWSKIQPITGGDNNDDKDEEVETKVEARGCSRSCSPMDIDMDHEDELASRDLPTENDENSVTFLAQMDSPRSRSVSHNLDNIAEERVVANLDLIWNETNKQDSNTCSEVSMKRTTATNMNIICLDSLDTSSNNVSVIVISSDEEQDPAESGKKQNEMEKQSSFSICSQSPIHVESVTDSSPTASLLESDEAPVVVVINPDEELLSGDDHDLEEGQHILAARPRGELMKKSKEMFRQLNLSRQCQPIPATVGGRNLEELGCSCLSRTSAEVVQHRTSGQQMGDDISAVQRPGQSNNGDTSGVGRIRSKHTLPDVSPLKTTGQQRSDGVSKTHRPALSNSGDRSGARNIHSKRGLKIAKRKSHSKQKIQQRKTRAETTHKERHWVLSKRQENRTTFERKRQTRNVTGEKRNVHRHPTRTLRGRLMQRRKKTKQKRIGRILGKRRSKTIQRRRKKSRKAFNAGTGSNHAQSVKRKLSSGKKRQKSGTRRIRRRKTSAMKRRAKKKRNPGSRSKPKTIKTAPGSVSSDDSQSFVTDFDTSDSSAAYDPGEYSEDECANANRYALRSAHDVDYRELPDEASDAGDERGEESAEDMLKESMAFFPDLYSDEADSDDGKENGKENGGGGSGEHGVDDDDDVRGHGDVNLKDSGRNDATFHANNQNTEDPVITYASIAPKKLTPVFTREVLVKVLNYQKCHKKHSENSQSSSEASSQRSVAQPESSNNPVSSSRPDKSGKAVKSETDALAEFAQRIKKTLSSRKKSEKSCSGKIQMPDGIKSCRKQSLQQLSKNAVCLVEEQIDEPKDVKSTKSIEIKEESPSNCKNDERAENIIDSGTTSCQEGKERKAPKLTLSLYYEIIGASDETCMRTPPSALGLTPPGSPWKEDDDRQEKEASEEIPPVSRESGKSENTLPSPCGSQSLARSQLPTRFQAPSAPRPPFGVHDPSRFRARSGFQGGPSGPQGAFGSQVPSRFVASSGFQAPYGFKDPYACQSAFGIQASSRCQAPSGFGSPSMHQSASGSKAPSRFLAPSQFQGPSAYKGPSVPHPPSGFQSPSRFQIRSGFRYPFGSQSWPQSPFGFQGPTGSKDPSSPISPFGSQASSGFQTLSGSQSLSPSFSPTYSTSCSSPSDEDEKDFESDSSGIMLPSLPEDVNNAESNDILGQSGRLSPHAVCEEEDDNISGIMSNSRRNESDGLSMYRMYRNLASERDQSSETDMRDGRDQIGSPIPSSNNHVESNKQNNNMHANPVCKTSEANMPQTACRARNSIDSEGRPKKRKKCRRFVRRKHENKKVRRRRKHKNKDRKRTTQSNKEVQPNKQIKKMDTSPVSEANFTNHYQETGHRERHYVHRSRSRSPIQSNTRSREDLHVHVRTDGIKECTRNVTVRENNKHCVHRSRSRSPIHSNKHSREDLRVRTDGIKECTRNVTARDSNKEGTDPSHRPCLLVSFPRDGLIMPSRDISNNSAGIEPSSGKKPITLQQYKNRGEEKRIKSLFEPIFPEVMQRFDQSRHNICAEYPAENHAFYNQKQGRIIHKNGRSSLHRGRGYRATYINQRGRQDRQRTDSSDFTTGMPPTDYGGNKRTTETDFPGSCDTQRGGFNQRSRQDAQRRDSSDSNKAMPPTNDEVKRSTGGDFPGSCDTQIVHSRHQIGWRIPHEHNNNTGHYHEHQVKTVPVNRQRESGLTDRRLVNQIFTEMLNLGYTYDEIAVHKEKYFSAGSSSAQLTCMLELESELFDHRNDQAKQRNVVTDRYGAIAYKPVNATKHRMPDSTCISTTMLEPRNTSIAHGIKLVGQGDQVKHSNAVTNKLVITTKLRMTGSSSATIPKPRNASIAHGDQTKQRNAVTGTNLASTYKPRDPVMHRMTGRGSEMNPHPRNLSRWSHSDCTENKQLYSGAKAVQEWNSPVRDRRENMNKVDGANRCGETQDADEQRKTKRDEEAHKGQ